MARPFERRLILLGPRGCGKSTVGPQVAARLGVAFVDLDEEIQRLAGRTIAAIFADEGEPAFRDREAVALAAALAAPAGVVATGGGVVVREANRARLVAAGGVRVFLNADPAELWRRITGDPATLATRPALTAQRGETEVRQLLADRLTLYRAVATHELDVTHRDAASVADAVAALIGR